MYTSLVFAENSEKQTLTILSSLPSVPGKGVLASRYEKMFEYEVTSAVGNRDFNVIFKHKANSFDLWEALHFPFNVGVIWISHGEKPQFKLKKPILADYTGANVEPLFKDIHPNLRFLGIVGCYAESIFKNQSFGLTHPGLTVFFPDRCGLVTLKDLAETVDQALTQLDRDEIKNGFESNCPERVGLKARLHRSVPLPAIQAQIQGQVPALPPPPVLILSQNKILGVLPATSESNIDVFFPLAGTQTRVVPSYQFDLELSTSKNELEQLGHVSIVEAWDESRWETFAIEDEKLESILEYQGTCQAATLHSQKQVYSQFVCTPMPARLH